MSVYSQIAYRHTHLLWLTRETELRGEGVQVSGRRNLDALRGVFSTNCGTHTAMEARDGRELGDSLACVSSYRPIMEACEGTGHWPHRSSAITNEDNQLSSSFQLIIKLPTPSWLGFGSMETSSH